MAGEILVTGAAGFIGASVVAALAAGGFTVRAGVRRTPLAPSVAALPGVRPTPCSPEEPGALAAATRGAAAVVHAAHAGGLETAEFEKALLASAKEAGLGRLVHLSSIAVYGRREGVVAEDAPGTPPFDQYERLKRESEARIAAWCAATAAAATMLRAGAVYGPGSALWVDGLRRRIRSGGWPDFGVQGEGWAPLIHVDDVADAVRATLRASPPPAGEARAVNLVHPERVTWNRYAALLAAETGLAAPRRIGPVALLGRRFAAAPAKALRRLGLPTIAAFADFPGGGERALLRRRAIYPVDRALQELGWEPRISLATGLAALEARDRASSVDRTVARPRAS